MVAPKPKSPPPKPDPGVRTFKKGTTVASPKPKPVDTSRLATTKKA